MESTIQIIPPLSTLSSSVVSFLNDRLHTQQDLTTAPSLVSELKSECLDLDQSLLDLNSRLESSLLAYASFSDRIHGLFSDASSKLTDLGSFTRAPNSLSDDGGGKKGQILGEELPALAKEVARVETVRAYAGEVFLHAALRYGEVLNYYY